MRAKIRLTIEDKKWICNAYQQNVPVIHIQSKMHINWKHFQAVLAEFNVVPRLRIRNPSPKELEFRVSDGIKKCRVCYSVLPINHFYMRKQSPDGYAPACKKCSNDYQRFLRIKNLYGLSKEEYQTRFLSQSKCTICNRPEIVITHGKVHPLIVDHDHKNGKVRGAICHRCNLALGAINDNLFIAEQLASYIFQWRQRHAGKE